MQQCIVIQKSTCRTYYRFISNLLCYLERWYIYKGVGRFRIFGGPRFRILGGGGQIPSRHMTS